MIVPDSRDTGLDALRAAAVLLVLLAHGGYFLFPAWPEYNGYVILGWFGTDIFFALSGFLLTLQLLHTPPRGVIDALRYVAWRAWRILPLFWLFLIVHVLIAVASARALPDSLPLYAVLGQNLAWPHPVFFGEAWNLPILMLFSLALPGMVLGAAGFGRARRALSMTLLLALVAGVGLRAVWVFDTNPDWDEGVRKLVVSRIDACLYGALVACWLVQREVSTGVRRIALVVAALMLLFGAALFLYGSHDADGVGHVVSYVASGLGCASACVAAWGWRLHVGSMLHRCSAWLARHGFALYLVNMPLLLLMGATGLGHGDDALQGVMLFLLWLLLCGATAMLVFAFVERPLLRWRARVIPSVAATSTTH